MPFVLPDAGSAAYPYQAMPDPADFAIISLGSAGSGVVSGCAVSQRAAGANMSVDVAAGNILSIGTALTVSATNLVIGANATGNPRIDLVVVNAAGAPTVRVGTPNSTAPLFPALVAGDVALAAVSVPNAAASILTQNIVPKSVPVAVSSGLANPMNAVGQMIRGGTAGAPAVVATPVAGQYLGAVGSPAVPTWTAGPGASVVAFMVAASNASAVEKSIAQRVCDGSADDVDIQAALNLAAVTGGVVQLTAGTFNLAARVNIPSLTMLRGSGKSSTVLNCNAVATGIGVPDGNTQWTVSDLTLSGGVDGMRIPGSNAEFTIRNVQFSTCSGRGLITNAVERFILDNCTWTHCSRGGWRGGQRWLAGDADPDPADPATFTGFANGRTERFLVTNCRIDSCGQTGNAPGIMLQDSGPNFANGTHDTKFDDVRFGGQMAGVYNQGVGTFLANSFILGYGSGVYSGTTWGLNFIGNNGEVQGQGASPAITSINQVGSVTTYTANNMLMVNDTVTVTGCTPGGYNVTNATVTRASQTSFDVALGGALGTATVLGTYRTTYAAIYIADGYKCNFIDNQLDSYGSPRQDYGIRCGAYWSVLINNDCDGSTAGYLLTENSIDMRQNIGTIAVSGSGTNAKASLTTINGPMVVWSGTPPPASQVISPHGTTLILSGVDSNGDGSGTYATNLLEIRLAQSGGGNPAIFRITNSGNIHVKTGASTSLIADL